MNTENYNDLVVKLDGFIRKYYKNRLIKGGLYFTAAIAGFFLILIAVETIGRFGTTIRTALFFSFLLVGTMVLYRLIATPLLKLYQIGERISAEQAAEIVGKHFSGVNDKLLNTLELKRLSDLDPNQSSLILASIEQRSEELRLVRFSSAIDLTQNRKQLKFAIPPVALILVILFASPSLITEPAVRLLEHREDFKKLRPFDFLVLNDELKGIKNEDFILDVDIVGEEIPQDVYIELAGTHYRMDKEGNNKFKYTARNIQKNTDFIFYASGFYSEELTIEVFPRPVVKESLIEINYPDYLNKEPETFQGVNEMYLPEGSSLRWNIGVDHTDEIKIRDLDSMYLAKKLAEDKFMLDIMIYEPKTITALLSNNEVRKGDSLELTINVVKDLYPEIRVKELGDTVSTSSMYFTGKYRDDYGFTGLWFVYQKNNGNEKRIPISISKGQSIGEFYHLWDLNKIGVKAEDNFKYYFEIKDNDGFNGPKTARSGVGVLNIPSKRDVQEKSEEQNEETKNNLKESIEEAKELRKELEKLNKKLMEKKTVSWEEKKRLKELKAQQKNLQNKFEKTQKENKKNNERRNQLNLPNEDLLQKQKKLEALMEKVMDEDMKKMLEDIEKMVKELNKEKLQEQVDQLKLDNKDLEKELDRNLELFKQLEFEQKLDDVIRNLKDLKKKEKELAYKTLKKESKPEELNKKQEELEKEFEKIKKDMKDLEKKNNELEKKNKLPDTKPEEKNAEQKMGESKEQNNSGNKKGASKSQEGAAQEMEKMEKKLDQMQSEMAESQQSEDIEALRRLRQNLLELSFDQEKLIAQVNVTQPNDPKFVDITRTQKKLKDDSKMIEDSLFALSKRNVQIESMVNKEISSINENMDKAIKQMANRRIADALNRQQYVMTSMNNLALMLDESIQQSQKKQSSKKFGKKSCSKPGGGKPSMGDIKKSQKKLSDQLKKLQKQMKDGGKKPGGKTGNQSGAGRGSKISKEAAKMAAQQSAIRNELRRLMEGVNKNKPKVKGSGSQMKKLEMLMEQNEEDLVNMQLTRETIRRQEEIMSRLLESDKAEREREFDDKRESKTPEDKYMEGQILKDHLIQKEKQIELLETIPLNLKPFYRNKVNEYYNKF